MEVRFPNGVIVRAAALADRQQNESWRTFGLYLDHRWYPSWRAEVVEWPDYGLPDNWESAAEQIRQAFELAKNGERVEIGCAGGLGRTGTVLACMGILAGVPPRYAVEWVRTNYDRRAVETDEQASWVAWFAGQISHRYEQS